MTLILFHRNERRNVTTANRARLLSLHKLLTAILAHAEMTAGHYQCVLGVRQTDEALGIWVVVLHGLLTFLCIAVVRGHTIDRFEFEGKALDQGHLLRYVNSIDVLVSVLSKCAIGHHSILGAIILIIH